MDVAKFAKVHNPIHIVTDLIYVWFLFPKKLKELYNKSTWTVASCFQWSPEATNKPY